ncbi:MAG: M42 family peptidase [Anaerolineaceae bacterium]|nr:MAG: M42 family peptidase [Anaerolineaceae bacterium]
MTALTPPLKLLERLCNAIAISGDEGEVRKIVLEQVKPLADDVRVDALGNVLVRKRASKRNPLKVLLAAHMDEVGFMIVADEGDGFYRFEQVGSVDVSTIVGKSVFIGKDRILAVIGMKPVHLIKGDEYKQKISLDMLRLDTGGRGGVHVGDRVGFATQFRRAGISIFAKAFDDRLGVATLIEILKGAPTNIELLLAFTVQEEVGLRGAGVAAHTLAPDIAIAVDSTPARDLPAHDGRENVVYNTKLGLGPAIYIADSRTLPDQRLIRHFASVGDAEKIPYQFRQPGGGGTDAGAMYQQLEGIPALSISIPGRYAHTPTGLCRVSDWQNTLRLIHAGLSRITPALLKR